MDILHISAFSSYDVTCMSYSPPPPLPPANIYIYYGGRVVEGGGGRVLKNHTILYFTARDRLYHRNRLLVVYTGQFTPLYMYTLTPDYKQYIRQYTLCRI